jgi:hypothetical protein
VDLGPARRSLGLLIRATLLDAIVALLDLQPGSGAAAAIGRRRVLRDQFLVPPLEDFLPPRPFLLGKITFAIQINPVNRNLLAELDTIAW